MLISIAKFAEERGLDKDTVNAYIRNHEEIACELKKDGKNNAIETDSPAYKMLEEKYPLKAQVVIDDYDTRIELEAAKKVIEQLQGSIKDYIEVSSKYGAAVLALEDRKSLLDQAEKMRQEAEEEKHRLWEESRMKDNEISDLKRESSQKDDEIERLRKELEEERSKSWLKKLTGK